MKIQHQIRQTLSKKKWQWRNLLFWHQRVIFHSVLFIVGRKAGGKYACTHQMGWYKKSITRRGCRHLPMELLVQDLFNAGGPALEINKNPQSFHYPPALPFSGIRFVFFLFGADPFALFHLKNIWLMDQKKCPQVQQRTKKNHVFMRQKGCICPPPMQDKTISPPGQRIYSARQKGKWMVKFLKGKKQNKTKKLVSTLSIL